MTNVWETLEVLPGAAPEKLTAAIEGLLVSGLLQPGEKLLPERQFAAMFGLSRSTVREAIHELELKGTVERRPGRGTLVRPVSTTQHQLLGTLEGSARSSLQVHDLRSVIEPEVALRAALRATPADLLQMEQILVASQGELTPERSVELDVLFHAAVAGATQNPLLSALVNTTAEWIAGVRSASHQSGEGRARSLAGHWQIFEAISAKDPQGAQAAMAEHLQLVSTLGNPTDGGDRS